MIVIDSNILFSALVKNSTTRRLILEYQGSFLFPEFIFEELEKHKQKLIEKSRMEPSKFDRLLSIILLKVQIIPNKILVKHRRSDKNSKRY